MAIPVSESEVANQIKLTKDDFVSDQMVKWCPGCGDHAILSSFQKILPEAGVKKKMWWWFQESDVHPGFRIM